MLLTWVAAASLLAPPRFAVQGDKFLLDGKPIVLRSGEMHYPRVPRAMWRSRLKLAKAMGLNTICTYVFWNLHEARPGKFDFAGNLDLAEFLRVVKEEGLFAIVRPGPYICTELDFGGFPAWLLKDRKVKVRSQDPFYLDAAKRYLERVGKEIAPLTIDRGGSVIMSQVENEYGSYGNDHVYMAWVRDVMKASGYPTTLFTSDGPGEGMLRGGTLPDLTPTINFGGGAEGAFRTLAAFRPGTPRMIGEYWCGWFDHWGKRHHRTSAEGHVRDIKWCLANGVSFNLYMFHGGTNFGFMQGSNGGGDNFDVDTTSYDYDSPLDEAGRPTPKYFAFRKAIQEATGEQLPEPEAPPAPIAIPSFTLRQIGSLLASPKWTRITPDPLNFEELDQAHGLVQYRTTLPDAGRHELSGAVMDNALVLVDGKPVGQLDRRTRLRRLTIEVPKPGSTLDVVVESFSRINFGGALPGERKGLPTGLLLDGQPIRGWKHARYPLTSAPRATSIRAAGPSIWAGDFQLGSAGDTFLDTRGWGRGFVWINGRNLGRYWNIGPQQTLYVPASWLRTGKNEVVVLQCEPGAFQTPTLEGLREPILDEAIVADEAAYVKSKLSPVADGTSMDVRLPNENKLQTIALPSGAKGRYLLLETRDNWKDDEFATIAEIVLIGSDGTALSREKWKVLHASSEETEGEDGKATNTFDNQPTTFWHTRWSGTPPKHPHRLLLDLGASVAVREVRLLPRQDSPNGRLRTMRLTLRDTSGVTG